MPRSMPPARSATRAARRAAGVGVALWVLLAGSADAAPVRFSASFGAGARLGARTSVTLSLRVPDRLPPVTEVRLFTPPGIDFNDSGLGLATCIRPDAELLDVMHQPLHRPCPVNAVMGTGTATAELRLDPEEIYSGQARIKLYAGPSVADKPGLLVIADAYRPARTQLSYRGYLYVPPPGFGLGIALKVLPIPQPPFGAPVALSTFRLTVGSASLRYQRTVRGRRTFYRPRAIPLPRACPRGGFRFRALLRFGAVQRAVVDAHTRCPPPLPPG